MLGTEPLVEDVAGRAGRDEDDDDQNEPAPARHAGFVENLALGLWIVWRHD